MSHCLLFEARQAAMVMQLILLNEFVCLLNTLEVIILKLHLFNVRHLELNVDDDVLLSEFEHFLESGHGFTILLLFLLQLLESVVKNILFIFAELY